MARGRVGRRRWRRRRSREGLSLQCRDAHGEPRGASPRRGTTPPQPMTIRGIITVPCPTVSPTKPPAAGPISPTGTPSPRRRRPTGFPVGVSTLGGAGRDGSGPRLRYNLPSMSPTTPPLVGERPTVFISYSHQD